MNILEEPASAPFRVVCLGDSLTGPNPATPYLDKFIKYPDHLQLILETHVGPGRVEVVNRGHAGNTSAQALARIDGEVTPLRPAIVTVLIGGNNFGPQNHAVTAGGPGQLHADLVAIVEKIRPAGSRVLLLQYPDPRADRMDRVWTHLNSANPVIAHVAFEENVPTLELAPAFREAAGTHPLAELASPVDGVHLSPYGEVVVARAIFFRLRELGWLPAGKPEVG